MGKINYCRVILYHKCASEKYTDCKFYRKPVPVGNCHWLSELKYCSNPRAHKDAWERKQAAEYSQQKLTA